MCDMCYEDGCTHCCRLCLLLCLSFLLPVGRSAILLAASRILCSISSSLSRSRRELSEDSTLPGSMLPVLLVLRVGEGGTRRGDWGAGRSGEERGREGGGALGRRIVERFRLRGGRGGGALAPP